MLRTGAVSFRMGGSFGVCVVDKHAVAKTAYGHTLEQMDAAVGRLDTLQGWFKQRNIKLDYDGETGEHALGHATDMARPFLSLSVNRPTA